MWRSAHNFVVFWWIFLLFLFCAFVNCSDRSFLAMEDLKCSRTIFRMSSDSKNIGCITKVSYRGARTFTGLLHANFSFFRMEFSTFVGWFIGIDSVRSIIITRNSYCSYSCGCILCVFLSENYTPTQIQNIFVSRYIWVKEFFYIELLNTLTNCFL